MKAAIQGAEATGSGFSYQPPPPLPLPLPVGASSSSGTAGDGTANANNIPPFISGRKLLEQADDALDFALDAIYLLKQDRDEAAAAEPPPRSPFLEDLIAALTNVSLSVSLSFTRTSERTANSQ